MVHALEEIHRCLAPGGVLIDLRPLADSWPIEVVSQRGRVTTGHIHDLSLGLEDDASANRAVAQAEKNGWFARERGEFFALYYYWDSPGEMKEFVEEEWADFVEINEPAWKDLRSVWATADADARPSVRVKMLITEWRKA